MLRVACCNCHSHLNITDAYTTDFSTATYTCNSCITFLHIVWCENCNATATAHGKQHKEWECGNGGCGGTDYDFGLHTIRSWYLEVGT